MKKNTSYLNFLFIVVLFLFTIESNYAQSIKKIDSLKHILSKKISDSTRANTLYKLSSVFYPKKLDSSLFYANKSAIFSKRTNNSYRKALVFKRIGNIYFAKKEYEEAINNYKNSAAEMQYADTDISIKTGPSINLILCYANLKRYKEAVAIGESLLENIKQESLDDKTKEILFRNMGNAYLGLKDKKQAIFYVKKSIDVYSDPNKKTLSYIKNALLFSELNDHHTALEFLLPTLTFIENGVINEQNLGSAYRYLGENYLALENKDKATFYFNKYLENYSDLNTKVNIFTFVAEKLINKKHYAEAVEFLFPVLDIINDKNITDIRKIQAYNGFTTAYYYLNEEEKLISYTLKVLELAKKNNMISRQIGNLIDISRPYSALKKHDEAATALLEALELSETKAKEYQKSVILRRLGYIYYNQKDYKNAVTTFVKALDFAKKEKDYYHMAHAYCSLGETYIELKKLDQAKVMFTKAKKMFPALTKKATQSKLINIYLSLYVIDTTLKNYSQETFENHKKYIALLKNRNIREQQEKLAEIEIAYETEKKDKEITLLSTENELQKLRAKEELELRIGLIVGSSLLFLLLAVLFNRYRIKKKAVNTIEKQKQILEQQKDTLELQKEAIEEKNQENELLIKEIHHRVKNNLQIILSLLSAQTYAAEGNKKVAEVIIESQNKIKSMALIHQNLYNSDSLIKVPTASYFKDLIYHIKNSYSDSDKQITFKTNIDNSKIRMTLAVPLGLIVNELVTNAYKYAFEDPKGNNTITINFKKTTEKDIYRLEVFDNGKGLPKGFDIDTSRTFGLQMIKGLVNQFNGKVRFHKQQGTGFDIYIKDIATDEDNEAA